MESPSPPARRSGQQWNLSADEQSAEAETDRGPGVLRPGVPDEGSTFRQRLRLSYEENPIRGMMLLLLLVLAAGFLVAGIVAFWQPILEWFLRTLGGG